ncbi:MAG: hypothetical protein ACI8TX_002697 [Hyphomicrobiaceae bacterium]
MRGLAHGLAILVAGLVVCLPASAQAHGLWDLEGRTIDQGPAVLRVEQVDPELILSLEILDLDLLLELEEETLLTTELADEIDPFDGVYYRGRVRGVAGSWASLRRGPHGAVGAIGLADGLLVLDDSSEATLYDVPALIEGASTPRVSSPMIELELAVVADNEFVERYGDGAATRMADVVASFAAVFASQLNLKIRISASMIFEGNSDPFTEFSSSNLFNDFRDAATEFGNWRGTQSGPVEDTDLAHLFSNKSFGASPPLNAEFGFFGEVCSTSRGVSLSTAQSPAAASFQGLILAHEMGHNLNARHDGESPCESAPDGHIMASSATGTSFSTCSVGVMADERDSASCLDPIQTTTTSTTTSTSTSTTSTSTTTTTLRPVLCGDATEEGAIRASDALQALSTAVGSGSCPDCICDVNSSGATRASDALAILKAAVGVNVVLVCTDCSS